MDTKSLRILHASDLHLERPLQGVPEVPEHLHDVFLEAGYRAAERVFAAAIEESVDLVIFSGDVVDARLAGPRAVVFLEEQFERLATHPIAVYWAAGGVDAVDVGSLFGRLPDSVHIFPREHAAAFVHRRNSEPVAWVAGQSHAEKNKVKLRELTRDVQGLFSIGVLYRPTIPKSFEKHEVDYLALGGLHAQETHSASHRMAHYPGTPQGRSPQESGSYGCTLVDVDEQAAPRIQQIATDVVRWLEEHVDIGLDDDSRRLETILHERMRWHLQNSGGRDMLISWTIAAAGPVMHQLRQGKLAAELLAGLREAFGLASPAGWSLSLTSEPPERLPASCYEQETILGDFLRLVRKYQSEDKRPIALDQYLPANLSRRIAASGINLIDPARRQQLLHHAAQLGVELVGTTSSPPDRREEVAP